MLISFSSAIASPSTARFWPSTGGAGLAGSAWGWAGACAAGWVWGVGRKAVRGGLGSRGGLTIGRTLGLWLALLVIRHGFRLETM